jgi:hypothetical protein
MRKAVLALIALCCLSACQSPAPGTPPLFETEEQRYVWQMQESLRKLGLAAADGMPVGSVQLVLLVESRGGLVSCQARPLSKPIAESPPFNPRLAKQLSAMCWDVILPPTPLSIRPDDGPATIHAPMFFRTVSLDQLKAQMRYTERFAQDNYLWHTVFKEEAIDAVGRAFFLITPDAEGQRQTCRVTLGPHPNQPYAFHPDEALRQRLEQRCAALKPHDMPFYPSPEAGPNYTVEVRYMPWKKNMTKRWGA